MEIAINKSLLSANDQAAQRNRERLRRHAVKAVNLLGSPGTGKTALLEALAPRLAGEIRWAVIEGDLATNRDAQRIEATGARAVQINTGRGCHLDAGMVERALEELELESLDWIFIENVGNLVCPAGFDLGETRRVVALSVAEGEDKVEKYPPMFRTADALCVTKMDLLPYVSFSLERARQSLAALQPAARLLTLSAKTGEGVGEFLDWLRKELR